MKPLIYPVALCLIAFIALAGCKDEEGNFTSPQGQKFSFLQRPNAEVVAIHLAFPMDWWLQPGNSPYVPHIGAEVITTGGAEGYTPDQVLETMQDLNAQAFLYPQFATLRGGINVSPAQLDKALTLANAALRAPTFDGAWMQRSKDALAANALEANATSAQKGFYALRLGILGDTDYTEAASVQNSAAIAAVTADMLRDWHRQTVVAGRVVVAVAGPITAAEAGVAVDKLLAGLPRAQGNVSDPPALPYTPRTVLLHVPQAEKTTLTIMAPIPPSGSDDDFNDLIGTLVLGGDEQAVLFEEIRTKLRASYGMQVLLDNFARKNRNLFVTGEVSTPQTAAARDVIEGIYAKMFDQPLDAAAVARYKTAISSNFPDMHNITTQLASSMVEAVLDGRDAMIVTQLAQALDAVTPASIMARWRAHYPKVGALSVLAVSPDANALPGACVITQPRQILNCP